MSEEQCGHPCTDYFAWGFCRCTVLSAARPGDDEYSFDDEADDEWDASDLDDDPAWSAEHAEWVNPPADDGADTEYSPTNE